MHKEWPETHPDLSPGASGKRGAFDLAVLSPKALVSATLEQFRQGRITASIVVEVGLDYGMKHLEDDGKKMLDSGVSGAYLLHLSRVRDMNANAIEVYATDPPDICASPTCTTTRTAAHCTSDWATARYIPPRLIFTASTEPGFMSGEACASGSSITE